MSKHTPGPWDVVSTPFGLSIEADAPKHPGCRVHVGTADGHNYANAELLAAAPTLRDHLEAVLCAAERSEEFIEGERGKGQSVEQLYAAGEMPDELVAARAFLAQLKGEQP